MHILPPGFTRIRHYGFLSSAPKRKSLSIIRTFLNVAPQCAPTSRPWQEIALERIGMAPEYAKGAGETCKLYRDCPTGSNRNKGPRPINISKN
jgi:hypothetical protein